MNKAAIKIQSLGRGYIDRKRVRKALPKLIKRRDKRIQQRRIKAATKIQSVARMRAGKKIAALKKIEFMERERKRKQLEELDAKIEDIHSSHMNDLLAIRVQTGMREKLARK